MATILVVDDEIVLQEMLRALLESLGYAVVTMTTAEEAMQFCRTRQEAMHMMITDLTLPRIDGVQLANHVATQWPNIPILIISASPLLENIAPESLPPNTLRMKKPFDLDALENLLHELIVE